MGLEKFGNNTICELNVSIRLEAIKSFPHA